MRSDDTYRTIMERASVRKYEDRPVPRDVIERVAQAGQQAPFTGQMYSFVVTTDKTRREKLAEVFGRLVLRAPVFMLICIDFRKLEKFIAYKGRRNRAGDLGMLFLGIQDAAYAGQNIVLAAEAEGLGSCFLGAAPFSADKLIPMFGLPDRVYPLVGLVLGYPAEKPGPRPRIPLEYTLFWDEYQDLTEEQVARAMDVMDAGLIREGYYARLNARIPLVDEEDRVSEDEYGWAEHVSRKYGVHGHRATSGPHNHLKRQGIDIERGADA